MLAVLQLTDNLIHWRSVPVLAMVYCKYEWKYTSSNQIKYVIPIAGGRGRHNLTIRMQKEIKHLV